MAGTNPAMAILGRSDAGRLCRAPLRRLSIDRLARRLAQLLSAAPFRTRPGAHEIAAAGRARRLCAGRHRRDDARIRAPVRSRQAVVAAIPDLSRRRRASRFQLFDCQLPAPGQRADRRRAALDLGPARHDDAALFRDRLVSRRSPRLARRAALDALADAAALGVARDPFLSARPDPDVSARLPDPALADLRRLFRRRGPNLQLAFYNRRLAARAVARAIDHPCRNRRMGARHARHDGDDNGRGLRHLRRGERAEGADRLSALLSAQCDPATGDRARPRAWADPVGRGVGRSHLRLSRHRHLAVSGDPRKRSFRDSGRRVHGHRRAWLYDLCARRDLSLARPPHLLSPDVMRGVADIGLTTPGRLVLIIIAVSLKGTLTVNQMAIVVASLAWLYPTRTIRAQVLSLRERGYVEVARLSGMSGPAIIFFELMPNLLPYLAATLVSSVSSAILASIGLEVLGLGPIDAPTLGMTLYWVNFNAAMINGWWWWWTAPTVIILTVFLGLFFVTVGLDEIANPRLRRSA